MTSNGQIADILDTTGDLLELKGDENPFRVRAYRNAARSVRGLSKSLAEMVDAGQNLADLPDIGSSIAAKIAEIVETGTTDQLEDLRKTVPESLTKTLNVPGVGPKKAARLHEELSIDSIEDLQEAAENHKIRQLEGFGRKTEEKIEQGIGDVGRTLERKPWDNAREILEDIGSYLDSLEEVDRWEAAGSFRRGCDTVGDLDILIEAGQRENAARKLVEYEGVSTVVARGEEKVSIRLNDGFRIDFRFFDKENFGSALLYFTGSKEHGVALRRRAIKKDWKLNEYGLSSGDKRLAGRTEESVYTRLGLAWIPPELREHRGEIEAAEARQLPELIQIEDIRGDLQCHTTATDGRNSIREMALAAIDMGWKYLAITDHSKRVTMAEGLDDESAIEHAERIREVDDGLEDFWLLAGIEVDILRDGTLDLKEETLTQLEWVVGSIHYDREMEREEMTQRILTAIETDLLDCLGHPLGRIIGRRGPIEVDMDRIVEACVEHSVRLEINAQPERLDLPDVHVREAHTAGARFTLGTDAHTAGNLAIMPSAVRVARRGWLGASDVLNTKTAAQLRDELGK